MKFLSVDKNLYFQLGN